MQRTILAASTLLTLAPAIAQPFGEGDITTAFFDSTRSRNVTCAIHYPATSTGTGAPVATGYHAVIVLGHGFVMNVDAYAYFSAHFAPLGYITVLPTTEGGFAPDHAEFGADIAFLAQALQAANTDPLSPFFGHVLAATALVGHSMGGGAAVLGAAANTGIQAVVLMAPAETSPSAIAAAGAILAPTLVFAATEDCVTPIADHAQPMHDALTVDCRALVNITGGGHCYFGDPNFNCTFGEFTCGPNLTITRADQQDIVTDMTSLWLEHFLLGGVASYPALLDSLATSPRFSATTNCVPTSISASAPENRPTINASYDCITILSGGGSYMLRVIDPIGRIVISRSGMRPGDRIQVSGMSSLRPCIVVINNDSGRWVLPIVSH